MGACRVFATQPSEREFFIDNLLVRVHFIIVMIGWTGLAPWEFEYPFPGSLTSTFLVHDWTLLVIVQHLRSNILWLERHASIHSLR